MKVREWWDLALICLSAPYAQLQLSTQKNYSILLVIWCSGAPDLILLFNMEEYSQVTRKDWVGKEWIDSLCRHAQQVSVFTYMSALNSISWVEYIPQTLM